MDIEREAVAPEGVEAVDTQGLSIEVAEPPLRRIQARLPLDRVEAGSQLPFATVSRRPDYGSANQPGAVGPEGDPVMRAEVVRQQRAVTGAGIRVGVLSDGIDGLSQRVASGDLPAQGVTSRSFGADGNVNAGAAGTALLEIIHDVAPGAQLVVANFGTSREFIQAVHWLPDEAGGLISDAGPREGCKPGHNFLGHRRFW